MNSSIPNEKQLMNSLTLKGNGFSEFVPLKGVTFSNLPFNKGAILVLIDTTLTGTPVSDILYIGRSKKPTKRVFGGYLAGCGGKTSKKINSMLVNDGYIEKVAVSWMLSDNPKLGQLELLENFKKENGAYPAWNISKKPVQKSQAAAKVTRKPRPTRKKKPAKPSS